MDAYTKVNLKGEVDDQAPKFGSRPISSTASHASSSRRSNPR
jgi:hypothetical protein